MTAADYVKQFHDISVPEFELTGGGSKLFGSKMVKTPVTEYMNARKSSFLGKSYNDRRDFKSDLMRFFRNRSKDPKSGIQESGWVVGLTCSNTPISSVSNHNVQSAVAGKATLPEMYKVIQLLSYYHSYMVLIEKEKLEPLQTMVGMYFGLDCTGFVGNFINLKYPGVDIEPNDMEETFEFRAKYKGGIVREKVNDVKANDIIVFNGHIAIISEVIVKEPGRVLCAVSESRSQKKIKNGPQTNTKWLMQDNKGKYELESHDSKVSSVVRLAGM